MIPRTVLVDAGIFRLNRCKANKFSDSQVLLIHIDLKNTGQSSAGVKRINRDNCQTENELVGVVLKGVHLLSSLFF